jgi:hypothetical protein
MTQKNIFKIVIISFFAIFISADFVLAHQPRLVGEEQQVVVVENPEISRAFYAAKKSQPQTYRIVSNKDFILYVNLLIPKIPEAQKDLMVNIFRKTDLGDEHLKTLETNNFQWQEYYEPFASDWYYRGPEFRQKVLAGEYFIIVNSPGVQACPPQPEKERRKYVLAIGEKEEFPLKEVLHTILILPAQKKLFNKSVFLAYFNLVGLIILILIMAVLIVFYFAVIYARKKQKGKSNKKSRFSG